MTIVLYLTIFYIFLKSFTDYNIIHLMFIFCLYNQTNPKQYFIANNAIDHYNKCMYIIICVVNCYYV